jgi:hypothetical protein
MAKKAATILAEAQQELLNTNAKLSDTGRRRDQLLLANDATGLDAVEVELTNLQKAAVRQADRIRLLEAEAERETNERRVKERQGLIGRIEENLAERDAAGRRLQNTLSKAEREFRELIRLSEASAAAWPWPPSDLIPMLMSGATIARAVSHQLYKCGARPPLLGRPGEKVEVGFPGGVCVDHRLRGLVDQIPSLTDVLADGSRLASRIMRGGSAETPASTNGAAPSPPAASGNGETPDPVRTPDQAKLAALLKKQAALAEDITPAGEAAYQQVVAEIAALS